MARKHGFGTVLILLTVCCATPAEEVRGVISRFDPAKKELVVGGRGRRARGMALSFQLAPDAQVLIGREPGSPADLKPGARVNVQYEMRDGARVARNITVHGGLIREALKPSPATAEDGAVAGTLARVARTDREVVVVSPGPGGKEIETTFALQDGTEITRDQKPVKLADLKEGERVVVRAEMRDGKRVARSIQVGAAASAAAPPGGESRIERLRQLLRLADQMLEMAEQRQKAKP
jgi:hypothetical protein